MVEITQKQKEFLQNIHKYRNSDQTMREIGRKTYSTDRSTYIVLDFLKENNLVDIEKEDKHIIVTLTKKGLKHLKDPIE